MSKILLLNPPRYITAIGKKFFYGFNMNRYRRGNDLVYGVTFPMELAYLASYLQSQGHDVEIIDANAVAMLPREIYKNLYYKNPDYLLVKGGDSTILDDISYIYFAENRNIKIKDDGYV